MQNKESWRQQPSPEGEIEHLIIAVRSPWAPHSQRHRAKMGSRSTAQAPTLGSSLLAQCPTRLWGRYAAENALRALGVVMLDECLGKEYLIGE